MADEYIQKVVEVVSIGGDDKGKGDIEGESDMRPTEQPPPLVKSYLSVKEMISTASKCTEDKLYRRRVNASRVNIKYDGKLRR